jgi:hypothetical protein
MKHGVRERARYSLIPSITSGYSGGNFGFRRGISWRLVDDFVEEQREMEEE